MCLLASARRAVFLLHRWTGVAACLLMALWVISGVVMLFVAYPKLLPAERLGALPPLPATGCCVPVEAALRHSPDPQAVRQIMLTTIAGHPSYRLQQGDGRLQVLDARTGAAMPAPDDAAVLRSAQAFVPGAQGRLQPRIQDDRWTHSALLDAHRPLIPVQMDDPDAHLLYVSSVTGEVVMDVPRTQRHWNYLGAWLHWVYMFRDGSRDPVWSWLVMGLSAMATVSATAGLVVGIWRWRFTGRYKSGARTPYRELPLRWHHITGLVFGAVLVLWSFSGLMSMNPLGIFSPAGPRPDLPAYQGGGPATVRPGLAAHEALQLLHAQGFGARELEWKVLGGQAYLLAHDRKGASRLVLAQQGGYRVQPHWETPQLLAAAGQLLPAQVKASQMLQDYDAYYYRRGAASMYAAAPRELPVLRVQFADPGQTVAYISPHSGDMVLSLDRAQRMGRWLFNLLHSGDLPWMLRHAAARELALVALGAGTLALALTGVLLAYRRLRRMARH